MYSNHYSSSLISTPDLCGFTDVDLSTDSVTMDELSYTYQMTTSPMTSTTAQENPSVNAKQMQLYKTEYCRNWIELGECRYGKKCRYAHGDAELRKVTRHSRYKTQICRTYHTKGTCLYGNRCTFIHDYQDLTKNVNGGNKLLVGSSSLMDDGDGGGSEENQMVVKDNVAATTSGGGKLRQHSRFFATKTVSKDHQVPSIQPPPPRLSTSATTKTIKFQNKGVWNSKLGFGSPQPLAYATNLVCQQGLTTSPTLTTIPINTTMTNNSYTPILHQTYDSSLRSHPRSYSLPAYNSASMNRYSSLPMGACATPSQACYHQQYHHDLNTSTTTLDTTTSGHLDSWKINGGHRGSYSSYLSSSSSLKPTSFFII